FVLAEPRTPPPVQEVLTVVDIDAPPQTVWRNVITVPDLPPPSQRLFRIGVAAPLRARLDGAGVGAIRYCDFTTGSFVEPITGWEENRLLRFDITAQAPPMREWSPYRDVNPPHLDGDFRATRGEFRLLPLARGRTRRPRPRPRRRPFPPRRRSLWSKDSSRRNPCCTTRCRTSTSSQTSMAAPRRRTTAASSAA